MMRCPQDRTAVRDERTVVRVDAELQDLVPGFLENKHLAAVKMQDAVACGDYETVRVLGHRMKGACGGYGFDELGSIGAAIEQAARQEDTREIRRWIDQLAAYLERLEVIYE